MADDVRIATGLRNHRKTKRLKRLLGGEGCWALVCLFLWAGEERWTGDLSGLTDDDIEEEAGWDGLPGALVAALVDVKFIVGERGYRAINDWQEHNPYAASKGARIEKGKRGAAARWSKDAPGMPELCNEHAAGTAEQCPPAPTPTPSTSVANATGADAPAVADPIWHTGLSFLLRKGISNDQARRFLGKLKREAGDIDAAALLAQAETDDITDPIPWLSAAAVKARERRKTGQSAPASKTLNAIQRLEDLKHGMADSGTDDRLPKTPLLGFGPDPGDGFD